MNSPDALHDLEAFPRLRILVIGDVMLDEYIWGDVQRISPEAPVPVVEIRRRTFSPGGAANSAANIVSLGGQVELGGVIGEDDSGRHVRELLTSMNIEQQGLIEDASRPTTTKTRIIAHNQQMVRVDAESRHDLSKPVYHQLLIQAEKSMSHCDACILSDYNKGVISSALAQSVIDFAKRYQKPVVVDPKGNNYLKYQDATVIKPNLLEAEQATQLNILTQEDLMQAGQKMQSVVGESALLITRGAEGMSLFQPGRPVVHIPAVARHVFDVTGAGDTVVSTLAMALAAGASLEEGAHLANRAAGIVVGKIGTATVDLEDLRNAQTQ